MNDPHFQRVLGGLPPHRRKVYEVIRSGGPLTKNELHRLLGGKSHKVSFTNTMPPLQRAGLIREAGCERVEGGRKVGKLWEATPIAGIERQRARYAQDHGGPSSSQRVADLRRMEKGDFADWYACRRRIVELTGLLTTVEPMTFWEASPDEDLLLIGEELVELKSWAGRVLNALDARRADDATRTKIAKLRNTTGRTPSEAEAFQRKAHRLESAL
jgi:hypothetical protein